jgi:hypothetical protein
MTFGFSNNSEQSGSLIYDNSFDNSNNVSNSDTEPSAMLRKLTNSLSDFLAAPSAIFTGTDTAALLSYDVRPNFSSDGNKSVTVYTSFTKSKLYFQASKFLCGLFTMGDVSVKIKKHSIHFTSNILHFTSNI